MSSMSSSESVSLLVLGLVGGAGEGEACGVDGFGGIYPEGPGWGALSLVPFFCLCGLCRGGFLLGNDFLLFNACNVCFQLVDSAICIGNGLADVTKLVLSTGQVVIQV